MIINDSKVVTSEVREWKGLQLLHFQMSTCSLKVRVLLRELGLEWVSHPINLPKHENVTAWFLGINPRGVVPVLVHDGVVHVESNDILTYLDEQFSTAENSYFFHETDSQYMEAQELLKLEDGLHSDLRLLTVQFGPLPLKSEKNISNYEANGIVDEYRKREVSWWRNKSQHGITNDDITSACQNFSDVFSTLNERLEVRDWLMGERISIVDIAWFSNIQRLVMLGYPLKRHERLNRYYKQLTMRAAFKAEQKHPVARLGSVVFAVFRSISQLKGTRISKFLNA